MHEMIRNIYYGYKSPSELREPNIRAVERDEARQRLRNLLSQGFTNEQLELLRNYDDSINDYYATTVEENFQDGFKFGAKLIYCALMEE